MRIDGRQPAHQTAHMENEIDYELMDEAEALALAVFGRCAEVEHIEAVYERLLANRRMGLELAGAVTLH